MDGGAALAQVVRLADAGGPDWAVRLTAWATLASAVFLGLSALILALTAVYVGRQAKLAVEQQADARRTRHAELIVNLSRRWDEIMRSMQLFSRYSGEGLLNLVRQLYGDAPIAPRAPATGARGFLRRFRRRMRRQPPVEGPPIDDFITLIELPALMETIGVLERDGGLALSVVAALWGPTIVDAWVTWEQAVAELRERTNAPGTFANFEGLAKRLAELPA